MTEKLIGEKPKPKSTIVLVLKGGAQITIGTLLIQNEARMAFEAAAGRNEYYKIETGDSYSTIAYIHTNELSFISFLDTVNEREVSGSTRPAIMKAPAGMSVPRA